MEYCEAYLAPECTSCNPVGQYGGQLGHPYGVVVSQLELPDDGELYNLSVRETLEMN